MLGIVAILVIRVRVTSDESLGRRLQAFGLRLLPSDLGIRLRASGPPAIGPRESMVFRKGFMKKEPYLYDTQLFSYRRWDPDFLEIQSLRSEV